MKKKLVFLIALVFVAGIVGSALAAGTNEDFSIVSANRQRVGIIAYCADMYHNAGDTGLQAGKVSVRNGDLKGLISPLPQPPLYLDGPWDNLGQFGAQNLVDYFSYDDGIDRERDLMLIDGDLVLPTGTQLINNFDIIVAYTDNKCGEPIPAQIANSAAGALNQFISQPNKKLILTGFAFSSTLGFGDRIYASSPLTKGGPGNATCTRDNPCFVGSCPSATCSNVPTPKGPECLDNLTGAVCTEYVPVVGGVLGTNNAVDQACREFINNVNGPTSSSWATALTGANVAAGASLCINYVDSNVDGVATGVPFLAINAARNVVAVNAFPPDAVDIQKFWYGCILGDVVQYLSGDTHRCVDDGKDNTFCH